MLVKAAAQGHALGVMLVRTGGSGVITHALRHVVGVSLLEAWCPIHRTVATASEAAEPASVPLTTAAYQVWGANTGVGKSLVSSGLMKLATGSSAVSKPYLPEGNTRGLYR